MKIISRLLLLLILVSLMLSKILKKILSSKYLIKLLKTLIFMNSSTRIYLPKNKRQRSNHLKKRMSYLRFKGKGRKLS